MCETSAVDPAWLEQRVHELKGEPGILTRRILDDTTEFMGIDRRDVLRLDDEYFLVRGTEREKRFIVATDHDVTIRMNTETCVVRL